MNMEFTHALQPSFAIEEFDFETVMLDRRGQVTERRTGKARQLVENLGQGIRLEMVAVRGGDFLMGSPAGQGYADEWTQHPVAVAPFYLGRYPVTQGQWEAVVGRPAPCRARGSRRPVENVSWEDAQQFCRRLAVITGRDYRLPSEAQWEYACRAGTATPFCCGDTITTDLANYVGDSPYGAGPAGVYRHGTTEVGAFPPNAFGLYDMHGNVWEGCADQWHEHYADAPVDGHPWESNSTGIFRVACGGSWHDGPDLCRSAVRLKLNPREGDDFFGFRVAAPEAA